uniref:Uncharacterized protein n=1 Tax=Romanomermis culicivorax TaxID=13658 RepID=A0A915IR41_ROMCU
MNGTLDGLSLRGDSNKYNSRTISKWPCSAAHINAVEPSSSWMFRPAPASINMRVVSILP